jgi:diguanylate cyclase (GGDEF)-like protein
LFNHRLQKEVDERRAAEEKLKHLADTDSLTGLLNRRAFTQRYNAELARAQRYSDVFSIILIDLDFFKRINDTYGHKAGDTVLAKTAELLQENTRESDICCRFGGEEFILLLPKTAVAEARVYANRLCQKIRAQSISIGDDEVVSVAASIGVVEWATEDSGETTIIKADKALYSAKKHGRDQVVVWGAGL